MTHLPFPLLDLRLQKHTGACTAQGLKHRERRLPNARVSLLSAPPMLPLSLAGKEKEIMRFPEPARKARAHQGDSSPRRNTCGVCFAMAQLFAIVRAPISFDRRHYSTAGDDDLSRHRQRLTCSHHSQRPPDPQSGLCWCGSSGPQARRSAAPNGPSRVTFC